MKSNFILNNSSLTSLTKSVSAEISNMFHLIAKFVGQISEFAVKLDELWRM